MLSASIAVAAISLLVPSVVESSRELPTIDQLISETQALADSLNLEEPSYSACTAIAHALLASDRHDEGLRLIKSLEDGIGLIVYAKKFAEYHETALPLRKADFRNEINYFQYRLEVAQVLYTQGKLKEAETIRPLDNKTVISAMFLADYYARLAEDLISKHEHARANQMLKKALEYRVRHPKRLLQIKELESLAQNFMFVDDRLSAEQCESFADQQMQLWLKPAATVNLSQRFGQSEDSGSLASINHTLGNTLAADQWFQSAISILNETPPNTDQYQQSQLAEQFAEIGIRQLQTGRVAAGMQTVERSIRIQLKFPADDRSFHLSETIKSLCEAEQTQLAASKVGLISSPYWKVRAMHSCCHAFAKAGDIDAAVELLKQAETIARKETSGANEKTDCLLECALIWADDLANRKRAQKCIEVATKISARKKYKYHQRITFYKVLLKMFASAYDSIQKIREPQYKLRPLAELTRRMADAAR